MRVEDTSEAVENNIPKRFRAQRAVVDTFLKQGWAVANVKYNETSLWAKENGVYLYVGRNKIYGDTRYGNPFTLKPFYEYLSIAGEKGGNIAAQLEKTDRDSVVEKYRDYITDHSMSYDLLSKAKGKILFCHCYPKNCHANVIGELANEIH